VRRCPFATPSFSLNLPALRTLPSRLCAHRPPPSVVLWDPLSPTTIHSCCSFVNSSAAAVQLFRALPATRLLPPMPLPPGPSGDGGRAFVTRLVVGLAAPVVLIALVLLVLQRKRGLARIRSRVSVL
jgi:hypothetical protein